MIIQIYIMKRILFAAVIVLGFVVQGWGQEQTVFKAGDLIKLNVDAEHLKTNKDSEELLDTKFNIPNYLEPNILFRIIKIDSANKEYWIRVYPNFVPLKKTKENEQKDKSLFYNNRIFKVSEIEFLSKAKIAEKYQTEDRVSFGLLTLPFKFRFLDDKSFETNFNLNTTLNVRLFQLWNAGFYVQGGAGIGNTNLYNGNAPGVSANQEMNAATLTLLSGIMLQYKKVQAGLYVGWDHINNQHHYQWQYNGKPWFGFGIGYQLFQINLGESSKNQKQEN